MTEKISRANTLIDSKSQRETELIGTKVGRSLNAGDILALYGELGAGKTCFVKGLAQGLKISAEVKSPSFSIINEYPGHIPLVHMDFYRITKAVEFENLGWMEYLDADAVVVIEWAERIRNLLPLRRIDVYFQILNETERRLEIITVDDSGN